MDSDWNLTALLTMTHWCFTAAEPVWLTLLHTSMVGEGYAEPAIAKVRTNWATGSEEHYFNVESDNMLEFLQRFQKDNPDYFFAVDVTGDVIVYVK